MDAKTENHSFETYPRLLRPWKTNIALQVLAVPLLRAVFGRIALSYLHTCILLETRALAFILLSRLGVTRDIVFSWHILNLVRCVPESVFNDKWISLAVLHVGSIPGASVSDRIRVCDQPRRQRLRAGGARPLLARRSLHLSRPEGNVGQPGGSF